MFFLYTFENLLYLKRTLVNKPCLQVWIFIWIFLFTLLFALLFTLLFTILVVFLLDLILLHVLTTSHVYEAKAPFLLLIVEVLAEF